MGRIKIDLPQKILASVSIPVRITDINYGNHVGNNALVEIIHEARVQFLGRTWIYRTGCCRNCTHHERTFSRI